MESPRPVSTVQFESKRYKLKRVEHIDKFDKNNGNSGLYYSSNILRVIKGTRLRLAGHVARMEEGRSAFKILIRKPRGKRPLGRPRRRLILKKQVSTRGSEFIRLGL